MTGEELIGEITAMGFDSVPCPRGRLMSLINLAVRTLSVICPLVGNHNVVTDGTKKKRVEFSSLKNFRNLCREPVYSGGEVYRGDYMVDDCGIEFPSGIAGSFTVRYEKVPSYLTEETAGNKLELDERVTHLLPLLCAAYIWQEDEPDKAAMYMQQYRYELSLYRTQANGRIKCTYRSADNW